MRKLLLIGLALLILGLAAGCGGEEAATAGVRSGEVTITMKNMKFTPAKVTVRQGTKVTFVNQDVLIHDAMQVSVQEFGKAEPGFDTGEVGPGKSFTVTFDKPGVYPILCSQAAHFTAGMIGTITVVE
ncbi:MAG TPA: plastocyanin/azurin family copper-binding protein [Symbiobacteriaceae bacterium]|nr:plastocyanin/azurin family copper-binding protein [Symbiobacteriaceae bacterium]